MNQVCCCKVQSANAGIDGIDDDVRNVVYYAQRQGDLRKGLPSSALA